MKPGLYLISDGGLNELTDAIIVDAFAGDRVEDQIKVMVDAFCATTNTPRSHVCVNPLGDPCPRAF